MQPIFQPIFQSQKTQKHLQHGWPCFLTMAWPLMKFSKVYRNGFIRHWKELPWFEGKSTEGLLVTTCLLSYWRTSCNQKKQSTKTSECSNESKITTHNYIHKWVKNGKPKWYINVEKFKVSKNHLWWNPPLEYMDIKGRLYNLHNKVSNFPATMPEKIKLLL